MTIKARKDIKSENLVTEKQWKTMEYFLFENEKKLARKFFDEVYVCFKNDEIVAIYKSDFDIETVKNDFDFIISPTENIDLVITPNHFKKDDISMFKTRFTHLETQVGARYCLSF